MSPRAKDLVGILTDVRDRNGALTGKVLVNEARDPSHPLHHRFEWDDSKAGEAHRISQAESLIASVKVKLLPSTTSSDPVTVRAFIARREVGEAAPGEYVPVSEVQGDPDREAALLRSMERDIDVLRRRYRAYEDLFRRALGTAAGL